MTSGGRWPANVILSPAMAEVLDQQSGFSRSPTFTGRGASKKRTSMEGGALKAQGKVPAPGDEGGASRFFLNAGYEPWELEWIYSVGLRPYGTEEE